MSELSRRGFIGSAALAGMLGGMGAKPAEAGDPSFMNNVPDPLLTGTELPIFKFAMQAFFWLAVRALTKLGIAMAARRPMIATTIMISTSVKPAFRDVLSFILLIYLSSTV